MISDVLSIILAQPDKMLAMTNFEWEALLGQARKCRLLGRLALHCVDQGWMPRVPSQPRNHFEGALKLIDRQHHEVEWEVNCIRHALRNVPTPIVMLKGAAYFLAKLPPGRGRLFSDIDIMVEHKYLVDVESALFRAGWISEDRDIYNQHYYRKWMHELPPMRHVQRGTMIDVHHTITPPTSRFKVDGARLLESIEAAGDNKGVFILSPADMVLHSAVHLFQEGDFSHGLRDLLDIRDLLQHFGEDVTFWETLFIRARTLDLEEPLFHVFNHIRRRFENNISSNLYAKIECNKSHWFFRDSFSFVFDQALKPIHPSCNKLSNDIARWFLYVRSHYLRMPSYLIIPHLLRKFVRQKFPSRT